MVDISGITPPTLNPNTIKGTWRKDSSGYYKVFIRGEELPKGRQAEVEARSGDITLVTLTGTHSQASNGYLYWYSKVTETVKACTPPPALSSKKEEIAEATLYDLYAALGLD